MASAFLEADGLLPPQLKPAIVEHMVLVHQSVRRFSAQFAEELRRHNYVTVRRRRDGWLAMRCCCMRRGYQALQP